MKLQLLAILAFIARVVDAEDVEEAEAARPEIKASTRLRRAGGEGRRNLRDDVGGDIFFGRSTYCHKYSDGAYETRQIFRIFRQRHVRHGDAPGQCGQNCADLCDHQQCLDDFDVSGSGDFCSCIRNPDSRCGPNTFCSDDTCLCLSGYDGTPESPSVGCRNINECAQSSLNDCGANTDCFDEPGSYRCQCKAGYEGDPVASPTNAGCTDKNECQDPAICGAAGDCQNLAGTYSCACIEPSNCGQNAKCVANTLPELPKCECDQGFDGNPPGTTCTPDPCTQAGTICRDNARCNTSNSTNPFCQCDPGFSGNPTVGCEDDNECLLTPGLCAGDPDIECVNLPGTYACKIKEWAPCPSRLDSDCKPDLQCAQTSGSDSTYVCCSSTRNSGTICNGAYRLGEECPSNDDRDCEGNVFCGEECLENFITCPNPKLICCRDTVELTDTCI